jgi:hypothetical protein
MKKNEVAAPAKFFTPAIEPGIPMPATPKRTRSKNNGAQIRWPFAEMKVGDSVLVPDWAKPTRAAAYLAKASVKKSCLKTFSSRAIQASRATVSGALLKRT